MVSRMFFRIHDNSCSESERIHHRPPLVLTLIKIDERISPGGREGGCEGGCDREGKSVTGPRRRTAVASGVAAGALVLAACSSTAPRHVDRAVTTTTVAATTTAPPTTTTVAPTTVPTHHHHHHHGSPSTGSDPRCRAAAHHHVPPLPDRINGVGSATQVIVVTAPAYGDTVATLSAFQMTNGTWTQVFGPWQADVGYNGFAPPGQKSEGDGRTPSGSYGFGFFFGVDPNPGVTFSVPSHHRPQHRLGRRPLERRSTTSGWTRTPPIPVRTPSPWTCLPMTTGR